jgi:hypothetical protein
MKKLMASLLAGMFITVAGISAADAASADKPFTPNQIKLEKRDGDKDLKAVDKYKNDKKNKAELKKAHNKDKKEFDKKKQPHSKKDKNKKDKDKDRKDKKDRKNKEDRKDWDKEPKERSSKHLNKDNPRPNKSKK